MFNPRDLLGQLLQSGMTSSAPDRLGHALGPQGLGGGGNMLSDLLSSLGGGGGLGEMTQRAGGLFGQAKDAVSRGDPLAIGGLGALAGMLLGGGGGAMRGGIGGGLLAVLGTIAVSALRGGGAGVSAGELPAGLREPQTPAEEAMAQETAMLAVRAMINAAKADGEVDSEEQARIVGKLKEAGADSAAVAFVESELAKPMETDRLAAAVKSPEAAVQVYSASLLAIEVDTPDEAQYLRDLAQKLGLQPQTVQAIHHTMGVSGV